MSSDPGRAGPSEERTVSYQPEERYWTDYLRIALPVFGLLLLIGAGFLAYVLCTELVLREVRTARRGATRAAIPTRHRPGARRAPPPGDGRGMRQR